MRTFILFLWLAVPVLGQSPLATEIIEVSITTEPVTLEMRPFGDATLISGDLPKDRRPAVLISVKDAEPNQVTAQFRDEEGESYLPMKVGTEYLIDRPGTTEYIIVTIRMVGGVPTPVLDWDKVTVGKKPDDPTNPDIPDPLPDNIRDLSEQSARKLAEPNSARILIEYINEALERTNKTPDKSIVNDAVQNRIAFGLAKRFPPSDVNWGDGWLDPIEAAIDYPATNSADALRDKWKAAVRGLEDSLL